MLPKSLKKLVLRKELGLVTEVIQAINPDLCVQDAEGKYLLGNNASGHQSTSTPYKSAITIEGEETIGWVVGNDKASVAARLLSRLASRELEKRTITQDLLSKYKEITLLFKISESIVEIMDIDEIAQLVLDEAQQLVHSSEGSLLLLRETTQTLEPIATCRSQREKTAFGQQSKITVNPTQRTAVRLGEGIIGQIAATRRGEIVNHVISDDRYQPETDQQCNTLICIPLKVKDQLIGAITLHRLLPRPYRSEDFKRLTTLAAYAASIISMLTNERQLKESRQNELIYELSSQIRDSLELSQTLETTVHRIRSALSTDRCFFLWHRPDHSEHFDIVSEAKDPALKSITGTHKLEEVDQDFLQQIHTHTIIKVYDIGQLDYAPLQAFLQHYNCEALLALPMRTRAGHIGLLCCSSSCARNWKSEETKLLQAVSNQLIIAIDQAELYEHSRLAAQLAEEKAQALEVAMGDLRTMQSQLIRTEKMSSIGRMVAGVAHEINNPVTFIHGNLSHLENGILDMLDVLDCYRRTYPQATEELETLAQEVDIGFLQDDLPKLLSSMSTGTNRIKEIVLSLRNFSRLDQADKKPVNLHEGLESTLLLLNHRFNTDRPISIIKKYGELPEVECYAKQINQVFMSLLSNALDAFDNENNNDTSHYNVPTITITTAEDTGYAVIVVTDNGPGIPEDVRPYIFDPFFTTKEIGEGAGLGLSMSYQIVVNEHKGTLDCHTKVGKGSQFIVKLPRLPQRDRQATPPYEKSDSNTTSSGHSVIENAMHA